MKNFFVIAIMLVLLSTSVFALTATTLSGMIQMSLESVPTTFEKSIGVKNENSEPVLVKFTPSSEIKDIIVMEAYNITLEPNETRFVKFNLTATEMKKYSGSVIIVFADPTIPANQTPDQFAVSTVLMVLPKLQNTTPTNGTSPVINTSSNDTVPVNSTSNETGIPEDNPDQTGTLPIIAAGVIALLILAIIIINMRKGAKNE